MFIWFCIKKYGLIWCLKKYDLIWYDFIYMINRVIPREIRVGVTAGDLTSILTVFTCAVEPWGKCSLSLSLTGRVWKVVRMTGAWGRSDWTLDSGAAAGWMDWPLGAGGRPRGPPGRQLGSVSSFLVGRWKKWMAFGGGSRSGGDLERWCRHRRTRIPGSCDESLLHAVVLALFSLKKIVKFFIFAVTTNLKTHIYIYNIKYR